MAVETASLSEAQDRLAELWDRALADRQPVKMTRPGAAAAVLLPEDEYEGLLETAHLLRSPTNAERLLRALGRAYAGDGEPRPLEELRAGFERAEER